MLSLAALLQPVVSSAAANSLSLAMFIRFIRLTSTLKPVILHRQRALKNISMAPPALPENVVTFVGCRCDLADSTVVELWAALGNWIWQYGINLLGERTEQTPDDEGLGNADHGLEDVQDNELDSLEVECAISDRILFPPTRTCTDPSCSAHGDLLRMWVAPRKVSIFTHHLGVYEGYAISLTCKGCRAVYYPNYVTRSNVRQYYSGIPAFVQVSGHKYIQRSVLEHFTMLSVLSWTSATNAAHIYHTSLSRLADDKKDCAHFRLRPEHTWDGFVILALLRDAEGRGSALEVPSNCPQSERFTEAMRARSDRIRRFGQPEFGHCCTRCVRRVDNGDGTSNYIDCVITDGLDMGRPCCGVRHCTGELRTPQSRWCAAHQGQELFCVVEGCCISHRSGHRTCALHADVEEHHLATGKAMFTLSESRSLWNDRPVTIITL
ncbi:hypothetical protein OH77DRAFT_1476350 [Trametes cingulata]|nr:hypothetical protein OH77DRAFT_1476350 [Trametes cingulata]